MTDNVLKTTNPTRIIEFVNEFEVRDTIPGELEIEVGRISPIFEKAFKEGQGHVSRNKDDIEKLDHSSLPPKFQALQLDIDIALSIYTGNDIYRRFNRETIDAMLVLSREKFRFQVLFQLLCVGTKFIRNGEKELTASIFYRGMGMFVTNLSPSDMFCFPQVISTTTDKKIALEYAGDGGTLFEFQKDDTKLWCINMDAHSLKGNAEAEYLFHPAHQFTVISVEKLDSGVQLIKCKVRRCGEDDNDEDKNLKPPTTDQINDLGNSDEAKDDGGGDRRRPSDKTGSEPETKKSRPSKVDGSSEVPALSQTSTSSM